MPPFQQKAGCCAIHKMVCNPEYNPVKANPLHQFKRVVNVEHR